MTTPPTTDVLRPHSATAQPDGPPAWVWPLTPQPTVERRFDPPQHPWGAGHRGVDLVGAEAQQVRSAGAGVVVYAGLLAGRGVVSVSHGALRTTYEPVTPTVRVGARVAAGAVVGTLTTEQSHCRPTVCLHWGLRQGQRYLDPLTLLAAGPPRLLPHLAPSSLALIDAPPRSLAEGGASPADQVPRACSRPRPSAQLPSRPARARAPRPRLGGAFLREPTSPVATMPPNPSVTSNVEQLSSTGPVSRPHPPAGRASPSSSRALWRPPWQQLSSSTLVVNSHRPRDQHPTRVKRGVYASTAWPAGIDETADSAVVPLR